MKKLVGIIGSGQQTLNSDEELKFAYELGQALGRAGYKIVCGGLGGIMEAVSKGVKSVAGQASVDVVCIIPQDRAEYANPFCDIVIPTGMGIMRNFLVVRSSQVLIAISGGSGTLSEIAAAWQMGKKVLCVTGFGGWAARLAGEDLDQRHSGLLVPVQTVDQILDFLKIELG